MPRYISRNAFVSAFVTSPVSLIRPGVSWMKPSGWPITIALTWLRMALRCCCAAAVAIPPCEAPMTATGRPPKEKLP